MYAYPQYPNREIQSLDGIWDFAFLGERLPALTEISAPGIKYDEIMADPGCFDAAPKYAGKRGVGAYRRRLGLCPRIRYRLTFHAIGLAGRVLLDWREILLDLCPWSKRSAEFLSGPENIAELVVLIVNA